MARAAAASRSMARLFAVYAVISLVPVLVLGLVLASSYRHEAKRRGLAEGRSEAARLIWEFVACHPGAPLEPYARSDAKKWDLARPSTVSCNAAK